MTNRHDALGVVKQNVLFSILNFMFQVLSTLAPNAIGIFTYYKPFFVNFKSRIKRLSKCTINVHRYFYKNLAKHKNTKTDNVKTENRFKCLSTSIGAGKVVK